MHRVRLQLLTWIWRVGLLMLFGTAKWPLWKAFPNGDYELTRVH